MGQRIRWPTECPGGCFPPPGSAAARATGSFMTVANTAEGIGWPPSVGWHFIWRHLITCRLRCALLMVM